MPPPPKRGSLPTWSSPPPAAGRPSGLLYFLTGVNPSERRVEEYSMKQAAGSDLHLPF